MIHEIEFQFDYKFFLLSKKSWSLLKSFNFMAPNETFFISEFIISLRDLNTLLVLDYSGVYLFLGSGKYISHTNFQLKSVPFVSICTYYVHCTLVLRQCNLTKSKCSFGFGWFRGELHSESRLRRRPHVALWRVILHSPIALAFKAADGAQSDDKSFSVILAVASHKLDFEQGHFNIIRLCCKQRLFFVT